MRSLLFASVLIFVLTCSSYSKGLKDFGFLEAASSPEYAEYLYDSLEKNYPSSKNNIRCLRGLYHYYFGNLELSYKYLNSSECSADVSAVVADSGIRLSKFSVDEHFQTSFAKSRSMELIYVYAYHLFNGDYLKDLKVLLEFALKRTPKEDRASVLNMIVSAYIASGEPVKAEKFVNELEKLNKAKYDGEIIRDITLFYLDKGDREKAGQYLTELKEIRGYEKLADIAISFFILPDDAKVRLILGKAVLSNIITPEYVAELYKKEMAVFEKKSGKDYKSYFLASLMMSYASSAEALSYAAKSVELNSRFAPSLVLKGFWMLKKGDGFGVDVLKTAEKMRPVNDMETSYLLASGYILGEESMGRRLFQILKNSDSSLMRFIVLYSYFLCEKKGVESPECSFEKISTLNDTVQSGMSEVNFLLSMKSAYYTYVTKEYEKAAEYAESMSEGVFFAQKSSMLASIYAINSQYAMASYYSENIAKLSTYYLKYALLTGAVMRLKSEK